jgi:hypothetical protein
MFPEQIDIGPGWTRTTAEFTEIALEPFQPGRNPWNVPQDADLASEQTKVRKEETARREDTLHRKLKAALKWEALPETRLPGFGLCRIHISVFELPIGRLHFFLDMEADGDEFIVYPVEPIPAGRASDGSAIYVRPMLSWRGMEIQKASRLSTSGSVVVTAWGGLQAVVEVDLLEPALGKLQLSREAFLFKDEKSYDAIISKAYTIINQHLIDIAKEQRDRPAGLIVAAFADDNKMTADLFPRPDGVSWIFQSPSDPKGPRRFRKVKYPAMNRLFQEKIDGPIFEINWDGKPVDQFDYINWHSPLGVGRGSMWGYGHAGPDRVVSLTGALNSAIAIGLWTSEPPAGPSENLPTTLFPPGWSKAFGLMGISGQLRNRQDSLARSISRAASDWVQQTKLFSSRADFLNLYPMLIQDASKAAAAMAKIIEDRNVELWNALIENCPDQAHQLWELVFSEPNFARPEAFYLRESVLDGTVVVRELYRFSRDRGEMITDAKSIAQLFPEPSDPAWRMHATIKTGAARLA